MKRVITLAAVAAAFIGGPTAYAACAGTAGACQISLGGVPRAEICTTDAGAIGHRARPNCCFRVFMSDDPTPIVATCPV